MKKTIETLKQELDVNGQLSDIENVNGIYKVYLPKDFQLSILPNTDAIAEYYKRTERKSLLYSHEKLATKWLKSQHIIFDEYKEVLLYVGKADATKGRGLHQRVKELVLYGYGLCNNHRGGRALW